MTLCYGMLQMRCARTRQSALAQRDDNDDKDGSDFPKHLTKNGDRKKRMHNARRDECFH